MRPRSGIAAALGLCLGACVGFVGPLDIGHRGSGRVAVVYERDDLEAGTQTQLLVYDATGARRVAVSDPQSAHWLGRDALLVGVRSTDASDDYLPRLQWHRVDLASGASRPIGEPGLYFDAAPGKRGRLVALGVESGDLGDSELQVWDLAAPAEPLARRAQTLDRPRWSPGGRHLVVSQPRPDSDEAETHEGVTIEGVAITWPRLFRVRQNLRGELQQIHDGAPGQGPAPGGSLPLWWDEAGIWARQRQGLVRCSAEGSGCTLVYAPGDERSVVDGCTADGLAWLRVRHGEVANEIHRVSLGRWGGSHVFHPPPGFSVAGIDCTD